MPKKSVCYRFLDNPARYKRLIAVLFEREDFPNILTSDILRIIFKEVFLTFPSNEEILQFRNFICSRQDSIQKHISLWNDENRHMILLEEHEIDIRNKLKLFDVIVGMEFSELHFGSDLITEIMEKAWQCTPPTNAASLVRNFLKNHYKALKNSKVLAIPDKCRNYKLIKDSLVFLERKEVSKSKFVDKSLSEQCLTMLSWMGLSEKRIEDLISSEYFLDVQDITDASVGDMFFDEEVDIIILKNFMRNAAFRKLQQLIEGRSTHVYTCGKCSKNVVDTCIRCDSCLIWFHDKCAGIEISNDQSLSNIDYYCSKCITQ